MCHLSIKFDIFFIEIHEIILFNYFQEKTLNWELGNDNIVAIQDRSLAQKMELQ